MRSPRLLTPARRALGALLAAAVGASACSSREPPPGASEGPPSTVVVGSPPPGAAPSASAASAPPASAAPRASAPSATVERLVVNYAQVFLGPAAAKGTQIGYLKRGSAVRAEATSVPGPQCTEGWVRLDPVGFVCSRHLGTDLGSDKPRGPAVDDILPYRYGSNTGHGTPLYRTVPTRSEMAQYEPYLKIAVDESDKKPSAEAAPEPRKTASAEPTKKRKKRRRGKRGSDSDTSAEASKPAESEPVSAPSFGSPASSSTASVPLAATAATATAATTTTATAAPSPPLPPPDAADAGAPLAPLDALDAGADAAPDDSTKPWWQRSYEAGKGPDIHLADLTEGSDKVMARRMVRGFYIAIDHTFFNAGRGWHKTTSGMLAPADRFALVKPNEFHGQEIDEANAGKALAFVLAKQATKYALDGEGKPPRPTGSLNRYDRVFLSGKQSTTGSKTFRETTDGVWLRENDIAITEPGTRPAGVGDRERWIDVNLARQTLVAFEGDRPVFATLVSTGRKGRDKAHDHLTPKGMWRVREKHIAATMDGDGAASGDMPYSIEDVPYVMYFHESYALHGAFWHDNFGRQQSHGCVNLAPLDAKRLFFWSDPLIPKGWFGMQSNPDLPGSLVVVHD